MPNEMAHAGRGRKKLFYYSGRFSLASLTILNVKVRKKCLEGEKILNDPIST